MKNGKGDGGYVNSEESKEKYVIKFGDFDVFVWFVLGIQCFIVVYISFTHFPFCFFLTFLLTRLRYWPSALLPSYYLGKFLFVSFFLVKSM